MRTVDPLYSERLKRLSGARWKRALDVQRPYRWNLRRLALGRTLDVGCGIGRCLKALDDGSVGVDHNLESVAAARDAGLTAYTPGDFLERASVGSFDSMLIAHVLEHLDQRSANDLVRTYLRFVRPQGTVVLITPQAAGFATDPTHVRFVDFAELEGHANHAGIVVENTFSFPFPAWVGKFFPYNEFVAICVKPS
jgi:2-polyprenyl-3-methyl-5-hydroxy-6-metoxy-1,4-benzoquinol methylase